MKEQYKISETQITIDGQQYPVSTAQSALDKKMLEYRLQLSNGQHINPPPINVTVKGPNFDNLALTDTPGIVKSASSKEDQIKNKVFSDIIKETVSSNKNAIPILVMWYEEGIDNMIKKSPILQVLKNHFDSLKRSEKYEPIVTITNSAALLDSTSREPNDMGKIYKGNIEMHD